MAKDISTPIVSQHLEIPVIRGYPAVQDFGHVYHTVIQPKATGLLLAAVAGVTGNADLKWGSHRFVYLGDLSSLLVVKKNRYWVGILHPFEVALVEAACASLTEAAHAAALTAFSAVYGWVLSMEEAIATRKGR